MNNIVFEEKEKTINYNNNNKPIKKKITVCKNPDGSKTSRNNLERILKNKNILYTSRNKYVNMCKKLKDYKNLQLTKVNFGIKKSVENKLVKYIKNKKREKQITPEYLFNNFSNFRCENIFKDIYIPNKGYGNPLTNKGTGFRNNYFQRDFILAELFNRRIQNCEELYQQFPDKEWIEKQRNYLQNLDLEKKQILVLYSAVYDGIINYYIRNDYKLSEENLSILKKVLQNDDDRRFYHEIIKSNDLSYEKLEDFVSILYNTIQSIIINSPPLTKDIAVFRGSGRLTCKIGEICENKGIMSTSILTLPAIRFSEKYSNKFENGSYFCKIVIPKGYNVLMFMYTRYPHEYEFLLPNNVKFYITKNPTKINFRSIYPGILKFNYFEMVLVKNAYLKKNNLNKIDG